MKAISLKTHRIVTPDQAEYPTLAREFGTQFQHLAQRLDDPLRVEVLPLQYRVIAPDGSGSSIKRAEP